MLLTKYNWFRIKAFCKYFIELNDLTDLKKHVKFAKDNNLNFLILGDGSNILLNEDLTKYYVIKPVNSKIILNNNILNVSSGCSLKKLIDYCIENNLEGIENFTGIPGNLGGCVYMNIHYKDKFISDYIISVEVFEISTEKFLILNKNDIDFQYTYNIFKKNNDYIILKVNFKFNSIDDNNNLKNKSKRILELRNSKYPNSNTCGCFFYNIKEFELINRSIGYQIEKMNLNFDNFKNIKPSKNHKNIFVTNNNCSSDEVIKFANFISLNLIKKINYKPKAECRLFGFENKEIKFLV